MPEQKNAECSEQIPVKPNGTKPEQQSTSILNDPRLLYLIKRLQDQYHHGDDKAKLQGFILTRGAKYSDARKKFIIMPKGDPGGGKSSLIRSCLLGLRVKDSFPTGAAMKYVDWSQYDVLYLRELEGRDKDSRFKLVSKDDGGYSVTICEPDPQNPKRFVARDYEIPAITVASPTPQIDIDSQYERRAWSLDVDDSPFMTEQVVAWKVQRCREEMEQLLIGIETNESISKMGVMLKIALERLEPLPVYVPYLNTLRSLLDPNALRTRGDIDNIISFVQLVAYLHQKQRPTLSVNGKTIISATLEDLWYTAFLTSESRNSFSKGERRIREAIEVVMELQKEAEGKPQLEGFTSKDLASKIGRPQRTCRDILKKMWKKGWLTLVGQVNRSLYYATTSTIYDVAGNKADSQSAERLLASAKKEALAVLVDSSVSSLCKWYDVDEVTVYDTLTGEKNQIWLSQKESTDATPESNLNSNCAEEPKDTAISQSAASSQDSEFCSLCGTEATNLKPNPLEGTHLLCGDCYAKVEVGMK